MSWYDKVKQWTGMECGLVKRKREKWRGNFAKFDSIAPRNR